MHWSWLAAVAGVLLVQATAAAQEPRSSRPVYPSMTWEVRTPEQVGLASPKLDALRASRTTISAAGIRTRA